MHDIETTIASFLVGIFGETAIFSKILLIIIIIVYFLGKCCQFGNFFVWILVLIQGSVFFMYTINPT